MICDYETECDLVCAMYDANELAIKAISASKYALKALEAIKSVCPELTDEQALAWDVENIETNLTNLKSMANAFKFNNKDAIDWMHKQ